MILAFSRIFAFSVTVLLAQVLGKATSFSSEQSGLLNIVSSHLADFGARGDGITDDTASINRYLDSVRLAFRQGKRKTIVFGQGLTYIISKPLNFTGLSDIDVNLNGSLIRHVGYDDRTAIDMLGSSRITVHDGALECGSQSSPCQYGIQLGRFTTSQGYNENAINSFSISGYFSKAAMYNNSETLSVINLHLINRFINQDHWSYGLIQDGMQHWPIESQFVSPVYPNDQSVSFNEDSFHDVSIYSFGGPAIWTSSAKRHFYRGYCQSKAGAPAIVLWSGGSGNAMLDFDMHFEIKPSSIFFFDGPSQNVTLYGLSYRDHTNQSAPYLFAASEAVSSLTLQNLKIDIADFLDKQSLSFEIGKKWILSGAISSSSYQHWNMSDVIFHGTMMIGNELSIFNVN